MRWKPILVALGGIAVGIQLIPVDRRNPPVESEISAPSQVRAVLQRACYDCHSNQTRWPWYSYVAPVSWLVADDVHEGREHLNFSTWNRYSGRKRMQAQREIWEEVAGGEMPLWYYVPLHPASRLSEADLTTVKEWTGAGGDDEGE